MNVQPGDKAIVIGSRSCQQIIGMIVEVGPASHLGMAFPSVEGVIYQCGHFPGWVCRSLGGGLLPGVPNGDLVHYQFRSVADKWLVKLDDRQVMRLSSIPQIKRVSNGQPVLI